MQRNNIQLMIKELANIQFFTSLLVHLQVYLYLRSTGFCFSVHMSEGLTGDYK